MDAYDFKIIRELQQNGRISNQELSEKISLSPSPCLRRVRLLEEQGIIAGYTAVINQKKLGNNVSLYVRIRIDKHNKKSVKAFEDGVRRLDNVQFCNLISGGYDYILHIIIDSLEGYEQFLRDELHALPGIAEIDSSFSYGCIKPPPGSKE